MGVSFAGRCCHRPALHAPRPPSAAGLPSRWDHETDRRRRVKHSIKLHLQLTTPANPCGARPQSSVEAVRDAARSARQRPPPRRRVLRPRPEEAAQSVARRRGTTWTWRWATLWLTTLLLATNVPSASSATGSTPATCCTRSKNGPTSAAEVGAGSRRGDAAPPARVPANSGAWSRKATTSSSRNTISASTAPADDLAEHASVVGAERAAIDAASRSGDEHCPGSRAAPSPGPSIHHVRRACATTEPVAHRSPSDRPLDPSAPRSDVDRPASVDWRAD